MPFLALFFGVGVVLGFLVNVAEIALYARFTGLCNSFGFWALLSLRFWCLAIKIFFTEVTMNLRDLFKAPDTPWGIEIDMDFTAVCPVSGNTARVFGDEFEKQLSIAGFKPVEDGTDKCPGNRRRPFYLKGCSASDVDLSYDTAPVADLWVRVVNTTVWQCPSITHFVEEVLTSECFHIGAFTDENDCLSSLTDFADKASDEMLEFMYSAVSDAIQANVARCATIAANLAKETCWASDIYVYTRTRLGTVNNTFCAIDTQHKECYDALACFIRKISPTIIGAYKGNLLPFTIKEKTPKTNVKTYTVELNLVVRRDTECLPQFQSAYAELLNAFRSIDLLAYSLFPKCHCAAELDVDDWCTEEDWDEWLEDAEDDADDEDFN